MSHPASDPGASSPAENRTVVDRALPHFPGGTSLSHLCVYDWDTPDGLHGGSPHLHTLSTEAYVITAGRGEVHTISATGPARDALEPGSLLWFTPGTVHRLVNHRGLEMAVVMSNAGLPEAGDAVLTFPEEIVADAEKYAAAVALPDHDDAAKAAAARTRRDLALEGYEQLLAAIESEGVEAAMGRFYQHAVNLVRSKTQHWQQIFEANVAAETHRTAEQLAALAAGDGSHLGRATVLRGTPQTGSESTPRLYGMCGRLATWRT
ncbi:cupin domain-containing protein [Nesterenkonia ebinurensis]|uniref:cupin domain-containing protein n=1 Tax=Nesterenkonia ebinurensis TaxID=2608252 RepID=UPI001CC633AF|nr:cupin [Nesterenkonia ebinurensis]